MTTKPSGHVVLLLPPGWRRIDLHGDLGVQVDALVADYFKGAPRDKASHYASIVRPTLVRVVSEAAAGGASDLILPALTSDGAFRSTFVIAPMKFPDGVDPIEGLAAIAATDSSASLVDIHGLIALRIESTTTEFAGRQEAEQLAERAGVSTDDIATRAHRVQYFIGDPARPNGWIRTLCSTPIPEGEDAERWTEVETELFDGIMTTVRFLG